MAKGKGSRQKGKRQKAAKGKGDDVTYEKIIRQLEKLGPCMMLDGIPTYPNPLFYGIKRREKTGGKRAKTSTTK